MQQPVLLDLFAGEGGATKGYQDAGFYVIAVDNDAKALKRNPAQETYCRDWRVGLERFGSGANLIHASPPCQDYSVTKHIHGGETNYPRLIKPVRDAIRATGKHYVIENVTLARPELRWPVTLCGSQFGRTAQWHGETVWLRRHRLFECSFSVRQLECDHSLGQYAVTVAGHGRPGPGHGDFFAGRGYAALCKEVMGIDWATRHGLCEAIPPVYAAHIGKAWREGYDAMEAWQNAAEN